MKTILLKEGETSHLPMKKGGWGKGSIHEDCVIISLDEDEKINGGVLILKSSLKKWIKELDATETVPKGRS